MRKTYKWLVLFLGVIVACWGMPNNAQAQMPVTIAPQLIPPYSLQLSSFYQGASPRLMVTLINNDLTRSGLQVKLRMSIKGRTSGIQIITNPTAVTNTFVLQTGVPVQLSLNDFVKLFNANNLLFSGGITAVEYQNGGILPEDIYDFCFEAFEANTGERVSQQACAIAFFSFSDPPLLNAPAKGSNVKITEPANISFSWTPRHRPNPAEPTEYTFQIVEVNNSVNSYTNNPEAAFAQSKILYQEKTSQTTLLWTATHPLLIPGKMYAWRVKAANVSANEDKSIFLNGGYSEVSFFNAVPNCPELMNVLCNTQPGVFSLTWTPVPGMNSYWVSYRKKGSNDPWMKKTVTAPNVYVDKLEAGTTYEYTVSFDCGGYPVTSSLQTVTIAKPVAIAGMVAWKLNKTAYEQNRLPDSYEIPESEVYAVEDNKELKGNATPVGVYGEVKLRFFVENELVDSLLLRTDDKGKYKAEFPRAVVNHPMFVNGKKKVQFSAAIPGHTAWQTQEISFTDFSKNDLNGDITLGLNTLHLTLVTHVNSDAQQPENLSVEVFVSKSYYDEHLSFLQNKLATTSMTYNGEVFVLLAKDEAGKQQMNHYVPVIGNLPKLQGQKYLLRTTCGTNVQYEQIDDSYEGQRAMAWWLNNQDKKIAIQKSIHINNQILLKGMVAYNGVAKAAQTVTLLLKQGIAILSRVSAETDEQGKYTLSIPLQESGGKNTNLTYEVMVRDANNRLNNVNAPAETITPASAEKGMITKNFNFDFGKSIYVGRVEDEHGGGIGNVLVKVYSDNGSKEAITYELTNKYGFFTCVVENNAHKSLQFSYESEESGYYFDQTKYSRDFKKAGQNLSYETWFEYMYKRLVVENKNFNFKAGVKPEDFGLKGNDFQESYNLLKGEDYVLTDVVSVKTVALKKVRAYAKFKFVFKNGKGKAKIEFPDNLGTLTGSHNEVVQILLPFKDYNLRVTEGDKETAMLPLSFTRSFNVTDTGVTAIYIEDFVSVSGIVSNSENIPLQDAKVYIEGINREVLTDKNGAYRLVINKNEPYALHAVLKKHTPFSKVIQLEQNAVLNITLDAARIPEFNTLAGFEFTLTDIKPSNADPDVYLISGSLIPPGNEVFRPAEDNNALTFKNQPVKIDEDKEGNAVPTMNLRFNETEYNLKAFDFASVVLSDEKGIYMMAMKDKNGNDTRAIGGITGEEVILKLTEESNISKTGLQLEDATIRNSRHKAAKGLGDEVPEVVFVPEEHKINSLQKGDTFKVIMPGSEREPLLRTTLGNIVPATIVKASGLLTENGLSFEGGVSFPEVAGLKLMDDKTGYLKVKQFTFGDNYSLKDIVVNVDDKTPELAIQKIRAKIQEVGIYGIGTTNFGMSIGGYAYLKKPEKGSGADTLFINEFKFLKKSKGFSVAASFRIGGDGIGVKGLSFQQNATDAISMEYDSGLKSFKFAASGKLNYKSKDKDKGNSQNKFSAGLFPVAINRFEFATKDWSFLLMASANAKVSLGVASIKLSKLLVSIGSTGVSKDEMLDFLASDDIDADDDTGNDNDSGDEGGDDDDDDSESDAYQMVDESVVNWAIGFKGGLEFGSEDDEDDDSSGGGKSEKGISAGAHASLLVANIDNKISVDVNEIGLGIKSPAFELAVKVKFVANDEKTGFEGEGELTALETALKAKFGYYKYHPKGMRLFADVKVELPSPLITVPPNPTSAGPIQWYGIGGGFDFDTKEGKYMVEIRGDFNPVGVPEKTLLIKDGGVRIIFNTKCDIGIPAPELQIFGQLWMLDELWVEAEGSIDFCNTKVMLKVNGQVPIIPKTKLTIDGLLLAVVDTRKFDSSFLFLGVNANLDILDGLLKGNAFVGLGVNVERDHRLFPVEEKDKWWPLIDEGALDDDGARFHGINLKAELELNINDSDDDGFTFNHEINVNASGKVNLFFKFPQQGDSPELKLTANAKLDINGYVQRNIGCWVTSCNRLDLPSIYGSFNFAGGYGNPFAGFGLPLPDSVKNKKYWYATGDAELRIRDIVIIDGIDIDVDFSYIEGKKAEFNINDLDVDF